MGNIGTFFNLVLLGRQKADEPSKLATHASTERFKLCDMG